MAAHNTILDAKVGEEFAIKASANHTTGTSSYLYFNPDELKLVSKDFVLSSPTTGSGGVHHYVFEPLKAGTTHIIVITDRSWERKPSFPMTYKVFIEDKVSSTDRVPSIRTMALKPKVPIPSAEVRPPRKITEPCKTKALIIREISHLDYNRLHIIGCIEDDLDQLIYELNYKTGKSDWYEWYKSQELLADPRLVDQLLDYMDRHNITYKYVRTNFVS